MVVVELAVVLVIEVVEAVIEPVDMDPLVICPATPRPPETTSEPVPIVVLGVVFERVVTPVALSVPVIVVFPVERVPDVT